MVVLGAAPTSSDTSSPPLKNFKVGILSIWYRLDKSLSSSTFTLPTFNLPSYCVASSSTIGERTLHGPHQDAQKSTSTGIGDLSTSASKFSFVITISDIYVERVFLLIEAYRYSNFRLVVCQSLVEWVGGPVGLLRSGATCQK